MHRWHQDRALMLSRWRLEIRKHEYDGNGYPAAALPPVGDDFCHCYRGMGYFRKRKPLDCGRPRCGLCHGEKFFSPKSRHNKLQEALMLEWNATGGW